MKLLLTSVGISNDNALKVLVELLGKPLEEAPSYLIDDQTSLKAVAW
jgi:hypothetical protein